MSRTTALGALRHRDFALFWTAAVFSNSAAMMQAIAVPIVIYDLTGSTAWVGLASFCSLVPSFLLTPISGVLADRIPRRLILIATQLAGVANAVGFAVLWYADALTPGLILALQLVQGLTAGFQVAAWQSFVPTLVPRERLLDAVRLNSIQFTTARALGPATAAVILGIWGIGPAFLINAATFLPVVAVLFVVRPTTAEVRRQDPLRLRADLAAGARYVRERRAIGLAVVTAFVIAFLGQSLSQFAAPIAEELYGRTGSGAKSGLVTAVGVGSTLASLGIIWIGDQVRRSRMAIVALTLYGAGVLVVGLSSSYLLGLAGFFVCGLAHISVAVAMNTSIQIQVDEEFRGRVLSIYLMGVLGGLPAGALVMGLLGEVVDLHVVVGGAGVVLLGYLALAVLRLDGLRSIDVDEPDPAAVTVP